jgi:hypothetical protein
LTTAPRFAATGFLLGIFFLLRDTAISEAPALVKPTRMVIKNTF